MFGMLREHESGIRGLLGTLEPARLDDAEVTDMLRSFAAIEKLASSGKTILAASLAKRGRLSGLGDRSDAHVLASMTGTSLGRARGVLEAGARLGRHPLLDEAARHGALSEDQLSSIAKALEVNPDAEGRLLDASASSSLTELRGECARAISEIEDSEARRKRIHAKRYFKSRIDEYGMRHIAAGGNPEDLAVLELAVARKAAMLAASSTGGAGSEDAQWTDIGANGSPYKAETLSAASFDALVALARDALAGTCTPRGPMEQRAAGLPGSDAKIIVRVDHAALVRGRAEPGETCDISGVGPIAVSAVREMIDEGDPFLAAILTRGVEIAKVVHLGRRPNALQRTALQFLYPTCAVKGCGRAAQLEYDHDEDFATNSVTKFDNIDRLCRYHHMLKTRYNWRLLDGVGMRDLVPPDDPRHRGTGKKRGPPGEVA